MKDNCLLLFINSPSLDKIDPALKTAFGPEKACQIYTEMAKQVFKCGGSLRDVSVTAVYEGDSKHPDLRWLDPDDPGFLTPKGVSAQEKLLNALRWPFDAGAKRVVLLSVYSPGVPQDWIYKAFHMLDEKNLIIGSTQAGECYIMGISGVYPLIFEGYPWNGLRPCEELAERAKRARLSVYSLPEFYSIKDEKSHQQWLSMTNKPSQQAPNSDRGNKQKAAAEYSKK